MFFYFNIKTKKKAIIPFKWYIFHYLDAHEKNFRLVFCLKVMYFRLKLIIEARLTSNFLLLFPLTKKHLGQPSNKKVIKGRFRETQWDSLTLCAIIINNQKTGTVSCACKHPSVSVSLLKYILKVQWRILYSSFPFGSPIINKNQWVII